MATVSTDRRRGINASTAIKKPCVCATTANVTLSGEQTIDGITTSETRILVKNQTDASENGIYLTDSSSWTREPDWDGDYDISEGTLVFVSRGTANAQTLWRIATTGDITVGTTNVTISQQSLSATAILSDGSVEMAAHWVPSATNTYDLGEDSTPKRWRHGYLEGNLDVDGTGNFEGALTAQSSATITGTAAMSSNATVAGTIVVTGASSFSTSVIVGNTLTVSSASSIGDDLTVSGTITGSSNLVLTGLTTTLAGSDPSNEGELWTSSGYVLVSTG